MATTPQVSTPTSLGIHARMLLAGGLLLAGLCPAAASAAPTTAYVSISADQQLRFGAIVVPQSGTRIVSSSGNITDFNLMSVGANTAGPAQFTITYHRDPNLTLPIILITQVILSSVPAFTQGQISGQLSTFDTDLPGNPTLTPGQAQTVTWPPCLTADCTLTFHVGGRLDISSAPSGGTLAISLPMTAAVVTVL